MKSVLSCLNNQNKDLREIAKFIIGYSGKREEITTAVAEVNKLTTREEKVSVIQDLCCINPPRFDDVADLDRADCYFYEAIIRSAITAT